MHKYQWLRICAEEFKKQLEEYAKTDKDVAQFLKRWMPLYEKIQRREIRLPYRGYNNFEFTIHACDVCPMSPLAKKYGVYAVKNPLSEAQNNFSAAIDDDFSSDWYIRSLKEVGRKNPVDEPPPPEEDAPLPKPSPSSPSPPPEPIPWWKALSNKVAEALFYLLKNICG
jgi:hypothetical protein